MSPAPGGSVELVPVLTPEHFAHVPQVYRAKVARDLVEFVTPDRAWDYDKSNLLNDYQRHLYALFLKLAGVPLPRLWAQLYAVSEDVTERQRRSYVDDVVCSSIVGLARENGGRPLDPVGIA